MDHNECTLNASILICLVRRLSSISIASRQFYWIRLRIKVRVRPGNRTEQCKRKSIEKLETMSSAGMSMCKVSNDITKQWQNIHFSHSSILQHLLKCIPNIASNLMLNLVRLSSTRTGTSRVALMSAWVTVLTCLPTWVTVTLAEWKVAASWCTTIPIIWEISISLRGETMLITCLCLAWVTASDLAVWSLW